MKTAPDFGHIYDLLGPVDLSVTRKWGRWTVAIARPLDGVEGDWAGVYANSGGRFRLNAAVEDVLSVVLQSTGAWEEVRQEWRGVAR